MTLLDKCLKTYSRRLNSKLIRVSGPQTVRDLTPGQPAHVTGFSVQLSAERRALLQAYGFVPGYAIRVVQQSPVSVVQLEHAEIALEKDLAGEIFVSEDSPASL